MAKNKVATTLEGTLLLPADALYRSGGRTWVVVEKHRASVFERFVMTRNIWIAARAGSATPWQTVQIVWMMVQLALTPNTQACFYAPVEVVRDES